MDSAANRKDPSQPICSPSVGLHELSVNPDQAKATTHGVLRAVCIQDEEVSLPVLVNRKRRRGGLSLDRSLVSMLQGEVSTWFSRFGFKSCCCCC